MPVASPVTEQQGQNWQSGALCAAFDPEIFFSPGAIEHKVAKRICQMCPVREQCLVYAMETPIDYGIWGGLTERERRGFRRRGSRRDWWSLALERETG